MIDFPSSPTNGQVVTLGGNQYTYNLAKTQWQVTSPSVSTNLGGGSLGTIPYQSAVNTTAMLATSTAGYLLTSNGVGAAPSWQAAPVSLPTQTGNGGRLLTTDGSTASWSTAITISSNIVTLGLGTLISTLTGSVTSGASQVYLNGATSNRIDYNTNGVAAPAFTTRSVGTKIVYYPAITASASDYATGIEGNTLWNSIPSTGAFYFKWYAGTTNVMQLTGDGNLSVAGAFHENSTTVSANYTITTGKNAMSAGPITIANDVTVTVPDGSSWTIV